MRYTPQTLRQLAVLTLLLGSTSIAAACDVKITSLPYSITTSAVHCLSANLVHTSPGFAIVFASSDATLDLGGRTLRCASAQNAISTSAYDGNRIRNGSVRNCNYAVSADANTTALEVSDLTLIDNGVGISLKGSGHHVHDNFIRNGNGSGVPGIIVDASASVVERNNIHGAYTGMNVNQKAVLRDNSISGCTYGLRLFAAATYQNTLVSACAVPFDGSGVNAGGNF